MPDATELSAYSVQHNPWHASMYNAATVQTVAVGAFVVATMDTVEFDPSGMCTLGAGAKFTIKQDGIYLVCGAVCMAAVADTVRYSTALYNNATEVARGVDYSIGGASSVAQSSCMATLYCKVGDLIDIRAQNFVTNRAVQLGSIYTYLSIAYIGVA